MQASIWLSYYVPGASISWLPGGGAKKRTETSTNERGEQLKQEAEEGETEVVREGAKGNTVLDSEDT